MEHRLFAGFARAEITPEDIHLPLAGYGATHFRIAETLDDPLYVNALALGTERGAECVFLVFDLCTLIRLCEPVRKAVSQSTGLPFDRIFPSATHTHSAPDVGSDDPKILSYRENVLPVKAQEAASEAIADLKPASISYGTAEIGNEHARLNFIRHYFMTDADKKDDPARPLYPVGDNYGSEYASWPVLYCYDSHDGSPDHDMQIIRLSRENADDIVLLNFQAHATLTGGRNIKRMGSDFPQILRERVEAFVPGVKTIFFQGAAGNHNPKTRMSSEGLRGLTFGENGEFDHRGYGHILASYVKDALNAGLKPSKTDALTFATETRTALRDHTGDARVPEAEIIASVFREEGYSERVRELLKQHGFQSPYQCNAIIAKSKCPETGKYELNAIRLGDVSFITAPFELFSETGKYIKKHAPSAMTFIDGYACDVQSYLPAEAASKYCYERNLTKYVPGTAEVLQDRCVAMLTELFDR